VSPGSKGRDDGTATVEFVLVGLVLVVPLAYVVLTALSVQSHAYAVVTAARSAARAYVTAPSAEAGAARARGAAALALRDQGVRDAGVDVAVSCSTTPCLTPGGTVRVRVSTTVVLGGMPAFLTGGSTGIPVSATHVETVDPFAAPRT
jgi:Flp pilus assembly protein TadG